MANWFVHCCTRTKADKLTIRAMLMYFPNPAAILDVTASVTLGSSCSPHSQFCSPCWWSDSFIESRQMYRMDETEDDSDERGRGTGGCWCLSFLKGNVQASIICHDTMLSERRRCCLFPFKHVHFARGPQLEAGESSHKRSCTSAIKSEWCSHLIVSLPLLLLAPFLLRALPWQPQRALRLAASIPLPELWLCCRNCQSASDRLERRRRLCEYILINKKWKGTRGGGLRLGENWHKIWCWEGRLREKVLHLAEDTPMFPYLVAKAGDKWRWRRVHIRGEIMTLDEIGREL